MNKENTNHFKDILNRLDFVSGQNLVKLVKHIVDNRIGYDDRVELEKYIIGEIKHDQVCNPKE